jgi:hypothetical protein
MGGISLEILVENQRSTDSIAEEVMDNIGSGAYAGLEAVGKAILQLANTLVPVSANGSHGNPAGFLRDSGHVEIEGSGIDSEVKIVYDADYAAPVHERLDVHHPVGQAKFLEEAYLQLLPEIAEIFNREFISEMNLS